MRKRVMIGGATMVVLGLVIAAMILRTGRPNSSKVTPEIASQVATQPVGKAAATTAPSGDVVYLYLVNLQQAFSPSHTCMSPTVVISQAGASNFVPNLLPWPGYNMAVRIHPVAMGDRLEVALACNNGVVLQWNLPAATQNGHIDLLFTSNDRGGAALKPTMIAGEHV